MAKTARIKYFPQARLGDGSYARSGSLVVYKVAETNPRCPVWEVIGIQGTSATGPMLRLESVNARNRGTYPLDEIEPSFMRLVHDDETVERL
jgi:hypothetical protein